MNGWRAPGWDSLYRDDAEGWEQLTRAMHEIGTSSRERGVPVILVLFPDLAPGQWTTESYPYRNIHSKVGSAARDAGLQVLDLVPYFASEAADWKQWWATPYDSHPGVRAHAKAAEAVAGHIAVLRDSLAGDKGG